MEIISATSYIYFLCINLFDGHSYFLYAVFQMISLFPRKLKTSFKFIQLTEISSTSHKHMSPLVDQEAEENEYNISIR